MDPPTPLFPSPAASSLTPPADRPSLFELLAQEQLRDLLHPVFRYILTYFAQHYPRYLLRLLNHHEEAFALVLLLLERHHLKRHNASLSEHFYHLRLVPTSPSPIPTPRLSTFAPPPRRALSRKQRWGLLVFLVGLPYARARLQDYYDRLSLTLDPESVLDPSDRPSTPPSALARGFHRLYPALNLGLDAGLLSYDLAYLFERTDSYRPWHRLMGVRVARRTQEDEPPILNAPSLLSRLPPLLPPLLLLLKLSQWWYSPTSPRTLASASQGGHTTASLHARILPPRPLPTLPGAGVLPLTPPPSEEKGVEKEGKEAAIDERAADGEGGYRVGKDEYGTCPICRRKWQNPAVLPSGWVVCWRCGWDAVEGEEGEEGGEEEVEEPGVGDDVGGVGARVREGDGAGSGRAMGRRKGRCPMTGMVVRPGELRRVLV